MPAAKKAKGQTRRVKQETIDDALSLLQASSVSGVAGSTPTAIVPLSPRATVNTGPSTDAAPLIKKELDPEEQKLMNDRWSACRKILEDSWDTLPAVPSLKSRCELAIARGVIPSKIHRWFAHRKSLRLKNGVNTHPADGYELQIERPEEMLSVPPDDPQGLIGNPSLASSSLPPSSPPHTPTDLSSSFRLDMFDAEDAGLLSSLVLLAPKSPPKAKATPIVPFSAPLTSAESSEVQPPKVATKTLNSSASKGGKRGRKRKAVVDGEEAPACSSATVKTRPAAKKKRPKDKKVKFEPESTTNAPASIESSGASKLQDTRGNILPLGLGAYNSHTVPPHSLAAKAYTSILIAPLLLEAAMERNSGHPSGASTDSFAPVNERSFVQPSPYLTQPLPPFPAFEALDDPKAFIKDCKDVLRTSLKINWDLGLWDPVVEALPPNYFMDLGKDVNVEWPEIDWP
ncbi:hypothetical protein FRC12_000168 [Ceratobasidium sp. 428]|nr:hypothetical protein FRC12_000168 [Ceratobasidium sp. 428]